MHSTVIFFFFLSSVLRTVSVPIKKSFSGTERGAAGGNFRGTVFGTLGFAVSGGPSIQDATQSERLFNALPGTAALLLFYLLR
ncbi:hypothetical protein B0T17DRAFT_271759 [Bombardia bombarda]|uniref:Uncharacterized protein n=1 Tax=Bombardia bombarda TaxID=252184 RepID=A0AA40C543_9PEZI|nr:hypothetical protein B0T17DRAFT_271759 [Bombardia bombarda]